MRRMLIRLAFITVAMSSIVIGSAFANEIKLPQPMKTGGKSLFEVIDKRSSFSQQNVPTEQLSREELATILWAATGHNRDGSKWTVPMARGRAPYCKIYVVDNTGAYLYDWSSHSLISLIRADIRNELVLQDFARKAPSMLIITSDAAEIAKFGDNPFAEEFAEVLAGAMSQNIYLASEGVDVGARLVYSIERDMAKSLLNLKTDDKALFAVLLGKHKKN